MSNYLAIATVTATLQRLLQAAVQIDVPGAKVTTVRPEASGGKTPEVGVNIYLYQTIPNPAWRNYDLRNRRPKGELIKHAQAGLDLYYIMTFYGNDVELEPQRLLGSTVRTIVDNPILTPEMIRETVNNSTYSYLADSTLEQQLERVTIVPSAMNTEELSKIWSVFFQTPYVLSFGFQGGAVLIEGRRPSGRPLPIRSTQFYTTPSQPIIDQVVSEAGLNQPIVAGSALMIRGKRLQGERTQIRIGDAKVTPQQVSEKEIRLDLSSLSAEEAQNLRAGVQSLQVLHPIEKRSPVEPDRAVGSNVVAFVLCPTITAEVEVSDLWDDGDDLYSGEVRVQIDLTVGQEQRVILFLNELSQNNPAAYIFAGKSRDRDTNRLLQNINSLAGETPTPQELLEKSNVVVFPILDVKAGTYLVRVQIDGAESPLEIDANERYVDPVVEIG